MKYHKFLSILFFAIALLFSSCTPVGDSEAAKTLQEDFQRYSVLRDIEVELTNALRLMDTIAFYAGDSAEIDALTTHFHETWNALQLNMQHSHSPMSNPFMNEFISDELLRLEAALNDFHTNAELMIEAAQARDTNALNLIDEKIEKNIKEFLTLFDVFFNLSYTNWNMLFEDAMYSQVRRVSRRSEYYYFLDNSFQKYSAIRKIETAFADIRSDAAYAALKRGDMVFIESCENNALYALSRISSYADYVRELMQINPNLTADERSQALERLLELENLIQRHHRDFIDGIFIMASIEDMFTIKELFVAEEPVVAEIYENIKWLREFAKNSQP